ncbi:MAG: DUF1540 domain-containing protein [Firmicutes bacterium]|nr:DUF1540 domain-containing protein [Bacillota bacterium]
MPLVGMGKEEIVVVTNVSCTVNNCFFWAKDNSCAADSILITSDKAALEHSDMAVGQESRNSLVQEIGETPARFIAETACHTFKAR